MNLFRRLPMRRISFLIDLSHRPPSSMIIVACFCVSCVRASRPFVWWGCPQSNSSGQRPFGATRPGRRGSPSLPTTVAHPGCPARPGQARPGQASPDQPKSEGLLGAHILTYMIPITQVVFVYAWYVPRGRHLILSVVFLLCLALRQHMRRSSAM